MNAVMNPPDPTTEGAGRVRLIIDTTARRRQAVRLQAVREGLSISELLNRLIDTAFADALAELDRLSKKKDKKS